MSISKLDLSTYKQNFEVSTKNKQLVWRSTYRF